MLVMAMFSLLFGILAARFGATAAAVSYTHLDVYKRQLLYRRIVKKSVRLATSRNDIFMYLLLACAILLGAAATLTTQILGKPGGYNYRETIAVWFRSIFTLQPDVSLMTDVPLQFKLHIIAAFILFAAWPFTRLVHVVSAPVAYPTRPYVVYRSRRSATSTSRPDVYKRQS